MKAETLKGKLRTGWFDTIYKQDDVLSAVQWLKKAISRTNNITKNEIFQLIDGAFDTKNGVNIEDKK